MIRLLLRVAPRAALLAGLLVGATCASPAFAKTGVYWVFANRTQQPIVLRRESDPEDGCWDGPQFPDPATLPPGQTSTFYFEHGGCVDDNLPLVVVRGAGYDGVRLRLWVGDPLHDPNWPPMTRNVHSASSSYRYLNLSPMNVGTSLGSVLDGITFLGIGFYDTVRVDTVFQPLPATMPAGSYRASCNADFDAAAGWLDADCGLSSPSMVRGVGLSTTQLCAPGTPVSNRDGRLVCERWVDGLPRGSWLDSCQPGGFDAASGVLRAQCEDAAGSPVPALIDTHYDCEPGSPVSNAQGRMRCDRPFTPDGSYRSQCTRIEYRDGVLHADCRSFVPLPAMQLDYRGQCAPWSTVRLDGSSNRLACDIPK